MKTHLRCLALLVTLLIAGTAAAGPGRQVAITIDDLPRGGDGGPRDVAGVGAMTENLLRPFREQKIPVFGFVNAAQHKDDPEGLRKLLDLWLDAGAELGNHSFSHPDINKVSLDAYTADIVSGEPALRAALAARGMKLEFFRHPFLHTGPTAEIKKGLQQFLDLRGYRVAPVTVDDADYAFAVAYLQPELHEQVRREYVPYMESVVEFFEKRSVEVAGYEIPQILLIHANQLNADFMQQLLEMFRRRGYSFVTLAKALEDPVYRLPESYAGERGISWIHRWSLSNDMAKGMASKGEPDPPEWVWKAFEASRRYSSSP